MASLPLLFVFVLLAGLDAAAVLVAIERIGGDALPPLPVALAIHLVVAAIATAAVRLYPETGGRPSHWPLAFRAGLICLLVPVLGPLAAGWLVALGARSRRCSDAFSGIRLGRPLECSAAGEVGPSANSITEPLVCALRHGPVPEKTLAAPPLKHWRLDRRAVAMLRRLREQPDDPTRLRAQDALTSLSENRERQLKQLRGESAALPADHPGALVARERLASALLETADSRIRGPRESRDLAAEARRALDEALAINPADAACLFRKAQCLIRLGELDEVPDLYGRLCALQGATGRADRLELAYFAALGNWRRAAETVERLAREGKTAGIDTGQRLFWLNRAHAPVTG